MTDQIPLSSLPAFPPVQLSPEQLAAIARIGESLNTALAELGRLFAPAMNQMAAEAGRVVQQYADGLDRAFPGWRDQDWAALAAECDHPDLRRSHE